MTGRWHWYDLDHRPIGIREAEALLADQEARRIGFDYLVADEQHAVEVSTVFLVLDHGWEGPPVLYETMTFGLDGEGELVQRYLSRAAAEAGHRSAVHEAMVRLGMADRG